MDFNDLWQYDYFLPSELIRKRGIEPRDRARLFVYDTKTDTITHDFFYNLAKYLPPQSLVVLNETQVVPARLWLRKETGGKIEVFILANEWNGAGEIPFLVDRKCVPGMRLLFPNGDFFQIVRQEENRFFARLESQKTLEVLLDIYGETPVPHYLEGEKEECENDLRKRYQTVFAKTGASVAAPTASLHFTRRVFASLDRKGIDVTKLTLDIGLGTFAPLREEHFTTQKLHCERISVSEETAYRLNAAKAEGHPIVSVGTTALRTLETIAIKHSSPSSSTKLPYNIILNSAERETGLGVVRTDGVYAKKSVITKEKTLFASYSGSTDIFIFPPHKFRSADILVTNFHLPKTSLLLLVDAFLRHKGAKRPIISLYGEAIRKKYAFYSFGDSMLIV